MKSLRFLASEALVVSVVEAEVEVEESVRTLSVSVYPQVFKASYLHEQARLLRALVRTWPLAELHLQRLLGKTADCHTDLTSRTCHTCLEAIFTGLQDYVLSPPTTYGKVLRLVDLTALKDVEHQACPCGTTMGRWARTQLLARVCQETAVAMQACEVSACAWDMSIEVRLNGLVTGRSYEQVSQALLLHRLCPLKMHFLGFRADSLAPRQFFYVLRLARPELFTSLEVVHNVPLEAAHLEVLLSRVEFPRLRSLALPAGALDVRRLGSDEDDLLATLGRLLARLTRLTRLSLGFSVLTGHIRRLLSPLSTALESLELSNCCLSRVDMTYLSNSLHSENLVHLDLSGHQVTAALAAPFHKLLGRCSSTLATLVLEECGVEDAHVDALVGALSRCQALEELKLLGNPLTSWGLRGIFSALSADFPKLRYVEIPVPRECYPEDAAYPLDDAVLLRYDRVLFGEVREQLLGVLAGAGRGSVEVCTPLMGVYDADLKETSNELGVSMLKSFHAVVENFLDTVTEVDERRSQKN
ncbi:leucine-rich repeat-containing protein 14B-like [Entelurus aequoreus]|uniref:leucine-rich repeat-containing protein 14B-like n=1 Tax=Entelurus aequoreus TaxID=161455 RepID=UPI002B1DDF83|nr:leucine-rich repeat-containing protein 14B-like [Entelurus aequoreus]